MSISRTVARPLMASIFLVGPIATLRSSSGAAKKAEPVTEPIVRLAQRAGIPITHDPEKLVKINAGIQIAAGLCLATGRWPRLAATVLATTLVPTTVAGHDFWNESDPDVRKQQQVQLAKNLSLLGGLIIAAGDTDGKPGVAWLAKHAVNDLQRDLGHAAHTAKLETKVAALGADRGTAAMGATVGTALLAAGHRAAEALAEASHHAADVAHEKGPIVAAAAREHAHDLRSEAEPVIDDLRKQAQKKAKQARKQAAPVIKDLRKDAQKKAKKARKVAKKKAPVIAAAARDQAAAAREQAIAVGEMAKARLA